MGNGQNRSRRGGARTRHGPHRGGAAAGDRRNATQLVPPALVASAESTASANTEVDTEVDIEANAEREDASALDTEGESQFVRADEPSAAAEPPADEVMAPPAEPAAESVAAPGAPATPEAPEPLDARAEAIPEAQEEPPEAERRAPRGRFERFYAPGQGPRAEQQTGAAANGAGHAANHAASHTPSREPHSAAHAAPPSQVVRHVPAAFPPEASAEDDDDETESASDLPREDVRGPVGGLIDDLHELFQQDRTVASQGGNSRCGICYFHFPLGELVYREAEGFYVCQQCERSLGSARVSMVRRQQRQ